MMIHLRNEGPIQTAPQLHGLAQDVSTELQSWPGMIAVTHWHLSDPTRVDGAEFHVQGRGELGHIHLNGEIHLALTKAPRTQLVALKLPNPSDGVRLGDCFAHLATGSWPRAMAAEARIRPSLLNV